MKLWNKKNGKEPRRLPMGRKSKHAFTAYVAVVLMARLKGSKALDKLAVQW